MSLYDSFIAGMEKNLDKVGLMTGDNAIKKRFIFGAVLGGILVTYIKPSCMFDNGVPREWKLFHKEGDGITPTWFPWWTVPLFFSMFFGMLV
jgi:hypothetical protein